MVKTRLSRKTTLRGSTAGLRYQRGSDRPNASRLLCACLFVLILLILALLFQGFLILKTQSADGEEATTMPSIAESRSGLGISNDVKGVESTSDRNKQKHHHEAAAKQKHEPKKIEKIKHKEEKKERKMTREAIINAAETRKTKDYDYDAIRESDGKHESYEERYISDFTTFHNYTSTDVLRYGCNLTTVLVEPRLPTSDFKYSGLYTLESVATYASYSCVVIQTSSCSVLPPKDGEDPEPMSRQVEEVAKEIYKRALPMFRGMMERGLVRVTILDHNKYHLTDCTNFYTPSNAWMSVRYWLDEFIDKVDNEMVLIVQSDGVICRDFDVTLWSDLAFVGAPWAPNRWTGAVVCDQLRSMFENSWTNVQKDESASNDTEPILKLQNYCENGFGCGYNGGIVLRNWTWMVRAIQACPSVLYSGISTSGKNCVVEGDVQEDEYFTLVLHGMGAPMPTAYEAALFGVETLFAEQAKEYFGPYNRRQIENFLLKRWGKDGLKIEERMHVRKTYGYTYNNNDNNLASSTMRTIPVTFHSPWTYHALDITAGPQVQQECKFLQYIFDQSESVFQWGP
jgi:hypothetical protein